jgi:hypothetical protein
MGGLKFNVIAVSVCSLLTRFTMGIKLLVDVLQRALIRRVGKGLGCIGSISRQ